MNRKGFTLIELLIVVVIIGILAAIAIPKFANTKEKAYLAAMKSDLRNLVTAEEAYFADSIKYTTTKSCVNPAPAGSVAYRSEERRVGRECSSGSSPQPGRTECVSNANTAKRCGIYVGATTPALGSATSEGWP